MKFVLNKCFGGADLSDWAKERLENKDDLDDYDFSTDKDIINLIEEYGSKKVSGLYSNLVVCEIPDDFTDYTIEEYDGVETLIYVRNGKLCFA